MSTSDPSGFHGNPAHTEGYERVAVDAARVVLEEEADAVERRWFATRHRQIPLDARGAEAGHELRCFVLRQRSAPGAACARVRARVAGQNGGVLVARHVDESSHDSGVEPRGVNAATMSPKSDGKTPINLYRPAPSSRMGLDMFRVGAATGPIAWLGAACFAACIVFASTSALAQPAPPAAHEDEAFDFMNLLSQHDLHDIDHESWNAYGQFYVHLQLAPPFSPPIRTRTAAPTRSSPPRSRATR